MKCLDCYWFENPVSSGRDPQSCADIGELPGSPACPQFQVLKSPTRLPIYDEARAVEPKAGESSVDLYTNVFQNILIEVMEIQRAASIVAYSTENQINQQGDGTEIDVSSFLDAVNRVVTVLTHHRLLIGLGAGPYLDAAMDHLIADKFGRRELSPATLYQLQGLKQNSKANDEVSGHQDLSHKSLDRLSKHQDAAMDKVKATLSELLKKTK